MSQVPGTLITRNYADFRGVDFSNKEVSLNRSPDSKNMWKDYKNNLGRCIETRPDIELVEEYDNTIFGLFFYKVGNTEMQIVHCGTKLYKVVNDVKTELFTSMNPTRSQSFIFNNIFYIKDGINYLKYDGTTINSVEVNAYIPTTSIARKPYSGGSVYEDVNMLTPYRKNTFVGDGERRPLCEALVKELGLENRVHFLEARFDIPQLIANAFIGIQSSHWEGFGMSAVEIMACGIPVIASDADGLKQVVEGAGMIFKTGNEADLASKIQQLTTDDALYSRISKACLARSKEYSIDKTASKCLNIYKSILGTKANRTENLN